jgi:adenylate kinase
VAATDDWVVSEIGRLRSSSHIIIDSHALTREAYGFRAVPFSLVHLRDLGFDAVIALRCDAEVLLKRVKTDPGGRRELTVETAREIQILQQSLSLTYAVACACPFHVIDTTDLNAAEVLQAGLELLAKLGITPE